MVEPIESDPGQRDVVLTMTWGHGTYRLMDAEGTTIQSGKWMNVSKKVGGTWLIHADIWNTDAPE